MGREKAWAQAPIPTVQPLLLTSAKDSPSIFDGHAEILFDSTRSFTPEQAMAHPTAWRRMNSENDIKFLTGYTYWIRFRVKASPEAVRALHGEAIIAIPFAYARHLDCYLPNTTSGDAPYTIQYSGLDVPVDDRPVWWFGNTFRIPLDTIPQTVYLRNEGIVAVITQGYIISEVQLLNTIAWVRAFYMTTTGILLALFFYNLLLYGIVRDRVYLYYLGYLAFFGGFFFLYESGFIFEIPLFSRFVARTNPLAFLPFLHLGFVFTLLFAEVLLALSRTAPRWTKVLRVLISVHLVFMLVEWLLTGADRYQTFPIIYPSANISYVITICCTLLAAFIALWKNVFVARYYLIGWAVIFVSVLTYNLSIFTAVVNYDFVLANISTKIGIILEMIIFSVALAERIRVLQREKAEAGERERERIFRDLHDGLGAQIVEIAAMSEQLREEVQTLQENNSIPQQGMEWAMAITKNVHTLRNGLRETIWVLSTENDTTEALVSYLRIELRRMLETAQIQVQINIPNDFPAKPIPPETRRNIVMACRETCTNIMKHSKARNVSLSAEIRKSELMLTLKDDGIGFVSRETDRFSNGLKTMQRRMRLVGGEMHVESALGRGTTVQFWVPL